MMTMMRLIAAILISGLLLPAHQASGSQDTDKYYPLKPGMTWTYLVLSDKSPTRKIIVTNLPPREFQGVTGTPRKWDSGGVSRYYLIASDSTGVYRYAEQQAEGAEPVLTKPKVYYLKEPVSLGTAWDIQTKMGGDELTVELAIESVSDTVTVPAGTFKDCLKIKHRGGNQKGGAGISLEAYEWYAPDVGLVKSVVTVKKSGGKPETAAEHLTYQLESFRP